MAARWYAPDDRPHPVTAPEGLTAEILCARYAERVYRFAAMVANGDAEAEDIAQDALERAIRRLDQFDLRRGAIESWLWRIVVNAGRDAGRVASRRLALWERLVAQSPDPETAMADSEAQALARLADAELLAAVRRLNRRDRSAIALRFGADLDHAGVGAALGVSPAAARMAVRRALISLRRQLQEVSR